MKHSEKVKIARRMPRTEADDEDPRSGLFDTEAWLSRRYAIQMRVKRKQDAAHTRALERKEAGKPRTMTASTRQFIAGLQRRIDERKRRYAKYMRKQTV